MEIFIEATQEKATELAASIVAGSIAKKPDLVLGCATGRTMDRLYACLIEDCKKRGLSFSEVRTFNLDEYIGLARDDVRSYAYYMNQVLFSKTDIQLSNTHILDGMTSDFEAECRQFEAQISVSGGVDLQLLGIGQSGHIGFNEPLSSLGSRTRDKKLMRITREQNKGFFNNNIDEVPESALTMGVGTILDAREILLVATGEHKAEILAKALEGPITAMISATVLQLHPACKVIVDEAAASQLATLEYWKS